MLRSLALSLLLVPCLGVPQHVARSKDRVKALDAAAATPFLPKKGAEAVKRVVSGADERKQDEKVLDPLDVKPGGSPPTAANPVAQGNPGSTPAGAPTPQGQSAPQPQQAPAAPVFAWRLIGISFGKRQGMALFTADGKSVTVSNGAALDSETKILSVSRSRVVVVFHGKRLELIPW